MLLGFGLVLTRAFRAARHKAEAVTRVLKQDR